MNRSKCEEYTLNEVISEMKCVKEITIEKFNEYVRQLDEAWNYEKSKRIMCGECGDTTHIDEVNEDGICQACLDSEEDENE